MKLQKYNHFILEKFNLSIFQGLSDKVENFSKFYNVFRDCIREHNIDVSLIKETDLKTLSRPEFIEKFKEERDSYRYNSTKVQFLFQDDLFIKHIYSCDVNIEYETRFIYDHVLCFDFEHLINYSKKEDREESKKNAIAFLNDNDIRSLNRNKYMNFLLDKLGFTEEEAVFMSLKNIIRKFIPSNNSICNMIKNYQEFNSSMGDLFSIMLLLRDYEDEDVTDSIEIHTEEIKRHTKRCILSNNDFNNLYNNNKNKIKAFEKVKIIEQNIKVYETLCKILYNWAEKYEFNSILSIKEFLYKIRLISEALNDDKINKTLYDFYNRFKEAMLHYGAYDGNFEYIVLLTEKEIQSMIDTFNHILK